MPSSLVLFSDFSLSGGVLLGDLDSECWLSLGSGASESGAGDEKPYSEVRLRAAFPYVVIRFRGIAVSLKVAIVNIRNLFHVGRG